VRQLVEERERQRPLLRRRQGLDGPMERRLPMGRSLRLVGDHGFVRPLPGATIVTIESAGSLGSVGRDRAARSFTYIGKQR
jgi:hypothetical protein